MKAVLQSLVIGAFLVLGACAKDSGGGGPSDVAAVPAANTCDAGQTYTTQYGCLSQGSCPANYVNYGNQCIVATANSCAIGQVNTQYGCLAQGPCPAGQGQLNTQCVAAYGNAGYNNDYNSNYYQYRQGGAYYGGGSYYGSGGGYYGNPYGSAYHGGAQARFGAGFYIGGQAQVPGMYYGF